MLSFLHINMVKYVFYYVTFTTLKKKEETNGGPWGVLWGSYALWARPEEWEGVGRVNRGRGGVCKEPGAGRSRTGEGGPQHGWFVFSWNPFPEKICDGFPSITLPCELLRASSRLAPDHLDPSHTPPGFCEENTFIKRLKQIVLTWGSVP